MRRISTAILNVDRTVKRLILGVADGLVLSGSLWCAMAIRFGIIDFPRGERLDGLYFILPAVGITIFWALGLYTSMLRAMHGQVASIIFLGGIATSLSIPIWAYIDPLLFVPRTVPIVYALLVIIGVSIIRVILRAAYWWLTYDQKSSSRVFIYGAGAIGTQLTALIENAPEYHLVGLLDDDKSLHGAKIRGKRIYDSAQLETLIDRLKIDHILLALGEVSPARYRQIAQRLIESGVSTKTVPRISEILNERVEIDALKPLKIEDLLGRKSVEPITNLIREGIQGKTILVSGAAGTIGSEICRQIVALNPFMVIAYDVSEYGLYSIEQEFAELQQSSEVKVCIRLGSVTNRTCLKNIFSEFEIDLVYHAAAYKHVPIVEDNVLVAVENNIFGTKTVAEEAAAAGVEKFVLISTDKAVRPTSVMGATKRMAELVVQDIQEKNPDTTLSMVRFGNVLGSSGSVIPLFEKQIAKGGPVTLTHKDVTRYFMTTAEAAQLVLQAGFMASGGEVFVLDMGDSVKLLDLARLMIQLSGNTVKDKDKQEPGIEIREIGLRQGEKLYEEMLIEDNAMGTQHPKIMKAVDLRIDADSIEKILESLAKCVVDADEATVRKVLQANVGL